MAQQIIRCHRFAAFCQIARCGVQAARQHGHFARRKQRVVRQVTHAHRQVEILSEQIDAPWRQVKLQRDGRMHGDEGAQHVGQHQVGKVARHRHAQPTARLRLAIFLQGCHGIDLGCHLLRVFPQLLAELGDCQAARGAQQQALAQPLFQCCNAARHGGLGQTEPLGGTAEAAHLDDAGKDQEVVRFKLFHTRNNYIHLQVFRRL